MRKLFIIGIIFGPILAFAHLVDEDNKNTGYTDENKAYNSKYVDCGMSVEYTFHKPIEVEVKRY